MRAIDYEPTLRHADESTALDGPVHWGHPDMKIFGRVVMAVWILLAIAFAGLMCAVVIKIAMKLFGG